MNAELLNREVVEVDAPSWERPDFSELRPAEIARQLQPSLVRTPTRRLRWLERIIGVPVYAKLELFQHSGAFKFRGALRKLSRLPSGTVVAAASAGNHGLGVALVAERLGLKANVFVPTTASRLKRTRIIAAGAGVVDHGTSVDDAIAYCQQQCAANGWTYVSPFNDASVIEGNSTIAFELLEDIPDLDTVLVPIGGGGLISGIALGLRALGAKTTVHGFEPARYDSMYRSVEAGRIVRVLPQPTFADGLATNLEPASMTFPIVRDHVRSILRLTEEELAASTLALLVHESLLVEPAAAGAVVGLMRLAAQGALHGPVGIVLTGGNITQDKLSRIQRYPFSDPELLRLVELRARSVSDLPVQKVHQGADSVDLKASVEGPRADWCAQLDAIQHKLEKTEKDLADYLNYTALNDLLVSRPIIDHVTQALRGARGEVARVSGGLMARTDEDSLAEAEATVRWALQTEAFARGSLEWNAPSYSQSRVPQFFDLGGQDSPGVNYERYESSHVRAVEAQLCEVLGLPTDKLSITATSSGMAAYTLVEAFLLRKRLKADDTVLLAPYVYFEGLEQLEQIPTIKVVRAGGFSVDAMMAAVREHQPAVVFIDPLSNTFAQEVADAVGFVEALRASKPSRPMTVVIDGSMVSAATPAEIMLTTGNVEVIYYESCSKYQQLGLDAIMAGLVVHPVELRNTFDRMRRNSGTILYKHGAQLFPTTDRKSFLRKMRRVHENAVRMTERVRQDEAAMKVASVLFPGHPSHPDYDAASKMPFTGGNVTFQLKTPGANHRDQLNALIDNILGEARKQGIHVVKGVSFGHSVPRLSAASAMAEQEAPFLRLSIGDREPAQVDALAKVVASCIASFRGDAAIDEVETAVAEIIRRAMGSKLGDRTLQRTQSLREQGFNSLAKIMTIDAIEMRFGFEFDDRDLLDQNFSTVVAIAELVRRRLSKHDE